MSVAAIHDRVAVVTGSTSGMGEATARRFIGAGYGVVGGGRNVDKLKALEKELGPAFCGISGDVVNGGVVGRMFAAAEECFGRAPDIVVANAGLGVGGSVKDVSLSQFNEVLSVNVSAVADLLQQAARVMLDARIGCGGSAVPSDIVVIGSVVGRNISPFSAAYGASKAAVHALAEGLRRDVGPQGVRVTLIEPGIVASGFQASAGYSDEMVRGFDDRFGPLLTGDDVASVIQYVVSQPHNVHVCDVVVRPTRQDYP